jgi:hypothetical protein
MRPSFSRTSARCDKNRRKYQESFWPLFLMDTLIPTNSRDYKNCYSGTAHAVRRRIPYVPASGKTADEAVPDFSDVGFIPPHA